MARRSEGARVGRRREIHRFHRPSRATGPGRAHEVAAPTAAETMHVAAFLLAATCGVPLTSHRTEPLQLSKDLLRYRGGGNPPVRQPHQANSVVLAARKLCDAPGMLCAAGASKATMAQRHIRGIVFGGMDGILTTFALLAAAEGTQHTSSSLTLVIGLSTVLADALSMAAGEYLSAKAEDEMAGGASEDEAPPLEKGLAMFVAFTCAP